MKNLKKNYLISIVLTLSVGLLAGYLTKDYVKLYDILTKPQLYPPKWVFPVVWNILYIMMGYSMGIVYNKTKADIRTKAVIVYCVQLALNFLWPIVFFRFGNIMLALYNIIALFIAVLYNIYIFRKIDKTAFMLLIPYAVWTGFAIYLNAFILLLN